MSKTEHAIHFTALEQAELMEVEKDPKPLGPREVAGRTLASLISAGTELAGLYQGKWFPATPGYSSVFEVEEIGSEVTGIQVGDHVMNMGFHRSFQRENMEACVLVPIRLAPEVAVFSRLMGVSMSTLITTKARPPDRVLVMGLGPIGHLAAKIFASCGYDVIAYDHGEARRDLMANVGIPVLQSLDPEDPAIKGKISLVVECSGNEAAALFGCQVVRKLGEVSLVGVPWKAHTEISAFEIMRAVFHNYVILRSGWEWEVPTQETDFKVGSIMGELRAALEWLADGRIKMDGLYQVLPPTDCQQAYQELLTKQRKSLATVFDWSRV